MQTKDNDRTYQYEQNQFSDNRNVTTFNTSRNRLFAEKATVSYQLPKGSVLIGEEYTNSRSRNDFQNPEAILNKRGNRCARKQYRCVRGSQPRLSEISAHRPELDTNTLNPTIISAIGSQTGRARPMTISSRRPT